MNLQVQILPEAETDIDEFVSWYEHQKPALGADFFDVIYDEIKSLSVHSTHHPYLLKEQGVRWAKTKRFPHKILYYVQTNVVFVFAIVHPAMHDSRWKDRL